MGWPNPMCFRSMASSPEHVGQRRGETKKSRPRSYSLGLNLAIIRRGFIERETALETRTDLQKPPSHCRLGSNTAAPISASMLTVRSAVDVAEWGADFTPLGRRSCPKRSSPATPVPLKKGSPMTQRSFSPARECRLLPAAFA